MVDAKATVEVAVRKVLEENANIHQLLSQYRSNDDVNAILEEVDTTVTMECMDSKEASSCEHQVVMSQSQSNFLDNNKMHNWSSALSNSGRMPTANEVSIGSEGHIIIHSIYYTPTNAYHNGILCTHIAVTFYIHTSTYITMTI